MSFKGIANLKSIDRESLELDFSTADKWFVEALERGAPDPRIISMEPPRWAAACEASGALRLERLNPEYLVSGQIEAKVPAPCSRCGDHFTAPRSLDFKIFLRRVTAHGEDQESA